MRVPSRVGKISWRRTWQPTPVFLPGEPKSRTQLTQLSTFTRLSSSYMLETGRPGTLGAEVRPGTRDLATYRSWEFLVFKKLCCSLFLYLLKLGMLLPTTGGSVTLEPYSLRTMQRSHQVTEVLFPWAGRLELLTSVSLPTGLLTATVASRIHRAAQPALLYLVPFTLLPLLTMAYLKVREAVISQ